MEKIIAIVRFDGDDSVGIFPEFFEIPCPFYDRNKEDLEFFRDGLLALYKEFGYGGCSVVYSFEQAEEDRFEADLFDGKPIEI